MAYPRAPITEAIIELRFKNQLDQKLVERAAKALAREYVFDEPQQQVNLLVEPTGAKIQSHVSGMKLSSIDRTDIVVLGVQSFACSRLAPYTGWEEFSARAARAWKIRREAVGNPELSRIGVRYVNRIDVPLGKKVTTDAQTYLQTFPVSPPISDGPISGYTMQISRALGVDDCNLLLTSATVPSPLIGFASFLLDIDVSRENNLPRRPEDIWAWLDKMREHKNRVFESCITDEARKLFQ